MQRLLQNFLPPAALGAALALVSIGVVDAVSPQQAFEPTAPTVRPALAMADTSAHTAIRR